MPTNAVSGHVKIGDKDTEYGPDLAFIRLPSPTVEALSANCSFLNLVNEAQLSKSSAPEGSKQRDFVFGIVAEWSTGEPGSSKALDIGKISVQMNEGHTLEIAACDGCDRPQFTPLQNQTFLPPLPPERFFPPKSYGGTSGGGLWRRYTEPTSDGNERFVQSRLLGVPYFEKELDGKLTIICHGPNSIYRTLSEAIRNRWRDEIAMVGSRS